MGSPLERLPWELLSYSLDFLNLKDLLSVDSAVKKCESMRFLFEQSCHCLTIFSREMLSTSVISWLLRQNIYVSSIKLWRILGDTIQYIHKCREHIKEIQYLPLEGDKILSGTTNLKLMKNIPSLTSLVIRDCPDITDPLLIAVLKENQQLVELSITNCRGLTNDSLTAIAHYCKKLKVLDLSSNFWVSNLSIQILSSGCSELELLDIHDNFVSEESLRFLLAHISTIQCLYFLGPRINSSSVMDLVCICVIPALYSSNQKIVLTGLKCISECYNAHGLCICNLLLSLNTFRRLFELISGTNPLVSPFSCLANVSSKIRLYSARLFRHLIIVAKDHDLREFVQAGAISTLSNVLRTRDTEIIELCAPAVRNIASLSAEYEKQIFCSSVISQLTACPLNQLLLILHLFENLSSYLSSSARSNILKGVLSHLQLSKLSIISGCNFFLLCIKHPRIAYYYHEIQETNLISHLLRMLTRDIDDSNREAVLSVIDSYCSACNDFVFVDLFLLQELTNLWCRVRSLNGFLLQIEQLICWTAKFVIFADPELLVDSGLLLVLFNRNSARNLRSFRLHEFIELIRCTHLSIDRTAGLLTKSDIFVFLVYLIWHEVRRPLKNGIVRCEKVSINLKRLDEGVWQEALHLLCLMGSRNPEYPGFLDGLMISSHLKSYLGVKIAEMKMEVVNRMKDQERAKDQQMRKEAEKLKEKILAKKKKKTVISNRGTKENTNHKVIQEPKRWNF